MSKEKQKKKGKSAGLNSISTKILVAAAIIVFIICAELTMVAVSAAQERIMESEVKGLEQVATEKSLSLEQYIMDMKVVAQITQHDQDIIQAGETYAATGVLDTAEQAKLNNDLTRVYEDSGEIFENFFVTLGSTGYADCQENSTLHDVADEEFYQECQKNGYFFGNNVSPVTGRPVYVIAYAIYDSTGSTMVGTVNMSIDMQKMSTDLIASDQYDVTILDLNGTVIADSTVAESGDSSSILTSVKDEDPDGFQNMLDTKAGSQLVDLSAWGGGKTYLAYQVSDNFIAEASMDYDEIIEPVSAMKTRLILIALSIAIVEMLVMFFFVRIIVKPLKKATEEINGVVRDIRNGKGDLTKKIACKSKDEVGIMVDGVNTLMEAMAGIISNVQSTTGVVNSSSNNINAQIESAEDQINNVSDTMQGMAAASEETSASLTQVMEQVDNVVALVESVNRQSVEEAKYADQVVSKVKDIQENSAKGREIANAKLQEVTDTLHRKIENAKQVSEIANLTDEILNITSQTNLLSLNASIEAARAGEAGKGFAVVADEIRQLADSSQEAANRIQEVTNSVIAAVEDLAAEAQGVTEFMTKNNDMGHQETENLTASYSEDIQSLAKAMDDFKANSDEIQNSMSTIKDAIDSVSLAAEETADGITNVAQTVANLSNDLQIVVGATTDNVNETNALSDEVNKFQV